jgi:hypothetical protein
VLTSIADGLLNVATNQCSAVKDSTRAAFALNSAFAKIVPRDCKVSCNYCSRSRLPSAAAAADKVDQKGLHMINMSTWSLPPPI